MYGNRKLKHLNIVAKIIWLYDAILGSKQVIYRSFLNLFVWNYSLWKMACIRIQLILCIWCKTLQNYIIKKLLLIRYCAYDTIADRNKDNVSDKLSWCITSVSFFLNCLSCVTLECTNSGIYHENSISWFKLFNGKI